MRIGFVFHKPVTGQGVRWLRTKRRLELVDVKKGRKFLLGARTRFHGLPYTVLAVGYQGGMPTIHLGEIR